MALLHTQPSATTGGMPPWPNTTPPRPHRNWIAATATLIAAAAGGAITGALITATSATPETPPQSPTAPPTVVASAETQHNQDITLCTTYAITNAVIPKPSTKGMDALAANAMMRALLLENPDASPEIRSALADVVTVDAADMAYWSKVRGGGLVAPDRYADLPVQSIYNRAWSVCGLDQ